MKWNLRYGLIIILLSTNADALNIQNGKLIAHKEWIVGNAKGSIKEQPINPADNLLSQHLHKKNNTLAATQETDTISTQNRVETTDVPANSTSDIIGFYSVTISNNTSASHTYTLSSKLCIFQFTDGTESCFESSDIIQLARNGSVTLNRRPVMTYTFDKTTEAVVYIKTSITRDHSNIIFDANNGNFLYVT